MIPPRDRRFALFTLFTTGFLAGLGVRTMTIALPVITVEFDVAIASLVSNEYYIVLTIALVLLQLLPEARCGVPGERREGDKA